MNTYRLFAVVSATVAALTLASCTSSDDDAAPATETTASSSPTVGTENLDLVTDFYNGFFNDHDASAASVIAEDYIQHNPQVPDGKAPFVNYFTGFFNDNPGYRSEILRSAVNEDLVFLHVHSTTGPDDRGQAVVDIFRVDDGKIVEHWDVIQDVPDASANENTMF